jgi:serine protease AprX
VAFAPSAIAAPGPKRGGDGRRVVRAAEPGRPNANAIHRKLDRTLVRRANDLLSQFGTSKVIVIFKPGYRMPKEFRGYARHDGELGIINGVALTVPNRLLTRLADHPAVAEFHLDRPLVKANYRTILTTGARAVQTALGYTGAGVGVAVIDSGIATWHDDLTNTTSTQYPYGDQRVSAFVDFVNGRQTPYDDDGHGTHVAGIIAGNGYDSLGLKSGSAPDASLAVLKVLDAHGQGTISNLIAALDWVLANHRQHNIRVVNMSVGAGVTESYWTDPLTLAAKRVVDAGIVVVGAAGNAGKNAAGQPQYGAIASPGNAPWVLTVGGTSTNGTADRGDDVMAGFSSRGPTYLDWAAKPDLAAPGTSTYSLAAPGSTLVKLYPNALLGGIVPTAHPPYLALSGTSMATPVVAGTVALMLQANPALTPNAVKAILQYTSERRPGYDALTQGAGFLNAVGAVRLAEFYASARPGATLPIQSMWSRQIFWGNQRLAHGVLDPNANAFAVGTDWGVALSDEGDNIVWGTSCGGGDCDNIVWGTSDGGDNIVWGTSDDGDNIVWGTSDAGDNIVWGTADEGDNIVWGTADDGDNIVWGTDCGGADCDNVVWGTSDEGDNIVWGTSDGGDNIVWGTSDGGDNIVWGTSDGGDNIVWGTSDSADNIVWGTSDSADNIVWGTSDGGDNIVWGTSDAGDNIVWGTATTVDAAGNVVLVPVVRLLNLDGLSDEDVFLALSGNMPPTLPPAAPEETTAPLLSDTAGDAPPPSDTADDAQPTSDPVTGDAPPTSDAAGDDHDSSPSLFEDATTTASDEPEAGL